VETLQHGYNWLRKFKKDFYDEYIRILNLLPESTWKTYKILGHNDLAEQIALRQAKFNLKEQFKKRPEFLIKKATKKRNKIRLKPVKGLPHHDYHKE
jgi:hypothetical protein